MRAIQRLYHRGIPSTLATALAILPQSVPYCERPFAVLHIALHARLNDLTFDDFP